MEFVNVEHGDLWKCILRRSKSRFVEVSWVRGHSGINGNEEADSLAKSGTTKDCLESMEEGQSDLQSDTNVA